MKYFLITLLAGTSFIANAEQVKTIVEFFSFTCSHCASVNSKLNAYIAKNHIKYMDVNIDNSPEAMPTNQMYYLATDAGVGTQFKTVYFRAVASGLPAYSPDTLAYVVKQVQNSKMQQLMATPDEARHIEQKLSYGNQLLTTYKVQATPSFLINQTTLLEGEDVINSLMRSNNE